MTAVAKSILSFFTSSAANVTVSEPYDHPLLGETIEINVIGDTKFCSFDCGYCDRGRTKTRLNQLKDENLFPSAATLIAATEAKLSAPGLRLNTILVSGNGEPTLHPDFAAIIGDLIRQRDAYLRGTRIAVMTNGAHLDNRKVLEALNRCDDRIIKIDVGNEKLFKVFNSPLSRTNLTKVIAGSRKLKDIIIQSFFCRGEIDNTGDADVEDWIEVVGMLRPKDVFIHGLSRAAESSEILRCEEDVLHTISSKLTRRTGIKARVCP